MLYEFLKAEFTRNLLTQARRARRLSGAAGVQAPRRSAPLQRRDAGRPEGHRREEPRRRRRARVPARAAQGATPRSRTACSRRSRSGSRRCPRCAPSRRRRGRRCRAAMHSRIAGTGSYLPAQVLTNDELAQRVDTSDEWIRTRTGIRERHIARRRRDDVSDLALHASRARARRGRASRRPTSTSSSSRRPRRTWSFRRPRASCRRSSARRGGAGVRRAGGVHRLRLRARARRPDGRARARRATRWSSAPRSIRASSTGTTAAPACCSATAPAPWCSCRRATPGILSAHLHADGRYATSCASRARSRDGAVAGTPFVHMDGSAVFKFAVQGAGRGRRTRRSPPTASTPATSTG